MPHPLPQHFNGWSSLHIEPPPIRSFLGGLHHSKLSAVTESPLQSQAQISCPTHSNSKHRPLSYNSLCCPINSLYLAVELQGRCLVLGGVEQWIPHIGPHLGISRGPRGQIEGRLTALEIFPAWAESRLLRYAKNCSDVLVVRSPLPDSKAWASITTADIPAPHSQHWSLVGGGVER